MLKEICISSKNYNTIGYKNIIFYFKIATKCTKCIFFRKLLQNYLKMTEKIFLRIILTKSIPKNIIFRSNFTKKNQYQLLEHFKIAMNRSRFIYFIQKSIQNVIKTQFFTLKLPQIAKKKTILYPKIFFRIILPKII